MTGALLTRAARRALGATIAPELYCISYRIGHVRHVEQVRSLDEHTVRVATLTARGVEVTEWTEDAPH